MKLRLDEYYYIIGGDCETIEEYLPEDEADKYIEFCESHNLDEINDYIDNLYSYIEVIDRRYNINDIDLEKAYINYTAIIKIKDKYYSFDWYDTRYWDFEDRVDIDEELTEVTLKEVTVTKYEPK